MGSDFRLCARILTFHQLPETFVTSKLPAARNARVNYKTMKNVFVLNTDTLRNIALYAKGNNFLESVQGNWQVI